ncbi:MAG TPA: alpha/beta fold hydrolase [Candidatus Dormibacteraeota bacterium]|nr:alpha/beta fold hydrolase [Candidatus Dormibacteraeota bacterium]
MDALLCTAADGARCAARVAGRNEVTLLFVHGVGSTGEVWDSQLAALSRHYRCAAVELRGNGVAPLPARLSSITCEGFARDVLAVADALGAERFHLIGCSLGGVVGLELWRTAPHRIKSLALLDSFAEYPDGQAFADRMVEAVLAARSMVAFAEERANRILPANAPAYRRTESVRQMACKNPQAYARATQAAWTSDYRALLPQITIPTLVLWGEHDVIAPRALSEELAAGIPDSRLVVVPDAGHLSNADAPTFVNAVLEAFVNAVEKIGQP